MNIKNFAGEDCPAEWGERADESTLRGAISPRYPITAVFGRVKQKNDGRWEWWIKRPRDFFPNPPTGPDKPQGVAMTEADAKAMVETFWRQS